tara:strand:- start:381 stop:1094 length:714 start_codon:yes stop_codon:yes gene_type:complete
MTNPTFTDNFIKYLLKLVPDNINQEFNFEVTEYKTGYIRINNNELESVYLICRPKKDSKLEGEIFIKYKFRDFHYNKPDFRFDKIYFRPDGHNEYRYDKDLNVDAIYLRGMCILPNLDIFTKNHYFEILKEWEKTNKLLTESNDYISVYQTIKNNKRVKIAYVISGERYGDHSKKLSDKTKKIIDSMTENFIIENCLYGSKGTFEDDKIIKSDPVYLIVYDKNAEEVNKEFKKQKQE